VTPSDDYVSRGGLKLEAALDAFGIDPAGWVCADFGANVGGFTDCLLRRGAEPVYAIDTGYGELAWRLRKDSRVVVMERTNALHCPIVEPVDLVVADMAWTPQRLIVPAARLWLRPGGQVLSLLKCHYEAAKADGRRKAGKGRVLEDAQAAEICRSVCEQLLTDGANLRAVVQSPLRGKGGNVEYWLWLGPVGTDHSTRA
jgi:23S rRNA (cytidine1920-2'-O)/16S rRNA (cytidine1409-2'-O)-methyltransferase